VEEEEGAREELSLGVMGESRKDGVKFGVFECLVKAHAFVCVCLCSYFVFWSVLWEGEGVFPMGGRERRGLSCTYFHHDLEQDDTGRAGGIFSPPWGLAVQCFRTS